MRFPSSNKLHLPCRFEQLVPGRMSADGRRVLPMIVLRPTLPADSALPHVERIGVVDRHHVVDPALVGVTGVAQLVWLLSRIRVQSPPFEQRLVPEDGLAGGRASTAPMAYGQVVEVLSWEAQTKHLPYESLYTELLLDVSLGVVGVRTSATAASLAEAIGKAQLEPGDYISVSRSRIDILSFTPTTDDRRPTTDN